MTTQNIELKLGVVMPGYKAIWRWVLAPAIKLVACWYLLSGLGIDPTGDMSVLFWLGVIAVL